MKTTTQNNSTTLLNPFSVSLKKPPFMELQSEPIFTNGDFKIYKYCDRYFIHTFKNIVICERCAPNKDVFKYMTGEANPEGIAATYHDFERPNWAKESGIQAAKELNFIIQ